MFVCEFFFVYVILFLKTKTIKHPKQQQKTHNIQYTTTLRALVCPPRSIELKDLKGHLHQLDVKVLGTEETWNTPSLLLAHNQKSGGSAVFSQVSLNVIYDLYAPNEQFN